MKFLVIFLFVFLISYTFAGIVGDTRITGRVLKYDKETVTLSQYSNKQIVVPRKSIEKRFFKKLKTGIVVTAVFSADEIMNRIQEQQELRKKESEDKKDPDTTK